MQGRFLSDPTAGQVYIGAETTRAMKLSFFERALGNSFLQIGLSKCKSWYDHLFYDGRSPSLSLWTTGRSLHPLLHYAFGDSSLRELPHITAPLWSFVDRLVVLYIHTYIHIYVSICCSRIIFQ